VLSFAGAPRFSFALFDRGAERFFALFPLLSVRHVFRRGEKRLSCLTTNAGPRKLAFGVDASFSIRALQF
jgi:hypothetical protein